MPIQKLAKAGAMGVGSELWITPNPEVSPWTRKIDWYLNFQMARAYHHEGLKISPELENILKENEVQWNPSTHKREALMVATQLRLPATQVVLIPLKSDSATDKENWIESVKKIWEGLGSPRLRIFLPLVLKESEFLSLWPEGGMKSDLTFVPGELPLEA